MHQIRFRPGWGSAQDPAGSSQQFPRTPNSFFWVLLLRRGEGKGMGKGKEEEMRERGRGEEKRSRGWEGKEGGHGGKGKTPWIPPGKIS